MGVLDGKVAIVTGGGRGIGAAIAKLFVSEGASVVVNDLGGQVDGTGTDVGPVTELVNSIRDGGGAAVGDSGDIADTATGERLVRAAIDEFGGLDIVVNTAGILRDRMIFNLPEEDWDAVIRVHLRGHFSTIKPASAYWRSLRNAGGHYRIINFTSISAIDGSPGQPNYAAAKMGIIGLTYSLAQALGKYGVTANAISPGAATRLVASVPDDRRVEDFANDAAMSPDNVAPTALYLASERSDWLTGRVISGGGYTVGLYNNPRIISEVTSDGPWTFDRLASEVESSFRPLADGLPDSFYKGQG